MRQKAELSPSALAELVSQIVDKGYVVNFDVTLELATPDFRVGSVRVHRRVESATSKKK